MTSSVNTTPARSGDFYLYFRSEYKLFIGTCLWEGSMPERKINLTPSLEAVKSYLSSLNYFVSLSNSMSRVVSHLGSSNL